MNTFIKFIRSFMGRSYKNEMQLQKREGEAIAIKSKMHSDITRIRHKVDRLNTETYNKLHQISVELESVTYHIAIATGGKKRGLK